MKTKSLKAIETIKCIPRLQLFEVEWPAGKGYEYYSSFVVQCYTEEEARNTHPCIDYPNYESAFKCSTWANSPEDVEVTHLGEARHDSTYVGVICASYHAG